MAIVSFDPSVLVNYYMARLPLAASRVATSPLAAKASEVPPWDLSIKKPAKELQDVQARGSDPYFDPKDLKLFAKPEAATGADSQLAALLKSTLSNSSNHADTSLATDNDKLFALYSALNRLDYIADMANREGSFDSARPGLNRNFQDGVAQILDFVKTASFAHVSVLPGQKSATAQSGVAIAYAKTDYAGTTVVNDAGLHDALSKVSATDQFTISITKGGVTTPVTIDLANVSGPLTLDNIDIYVNQQLAAAGFGTRFSREQTGGSLLEDTATWGIKVNSSAGEAVTLSSAQAEAAVYVAGSVGKSATAQGKLIKLTDLDGTKAATFSTAIAPDSGTASAKASAVDANGNVYVVGNATGSFGSEINQGSQDVFLTKYDSAGNVQWTKLLGAANTASGYSVAVDPSSGGVVIAGSVTGKLTPAAIGGNTDNFVAKYDSQGNQKWLRQVGPASNDQANSVSVDSSGNVFIGGQVTTVIASGQTNAGGVDGYVTKLDKNGAVLYHRQFGTAGADAAAKTAVADDGNLVVASVENGHAILTKYGAADGTSAALWQLDLGSLQGGTIGGLAVNAGKIYVSGTTTNGSLNAGVAHAGSGGSDAFVFAADDQGTSASADFVSYVGTAASEQGGGVAVANGKIYLSGTTTGTFAGQARTVANAHNIFVSELAANGAVNWTQQYGGADGELQGLAIAADSAGSSVLDALGLPRGKIDINQSNALESQTTVRAGDYFTLKVADHTGERNVKITISKGDTLRSLATKINGALLFSGKAAATPIVGGQALKVTLKPGVKLEFIAGSKDFDALAGLGLKAQSIVNDSAAEDGDKTKDATSKDGEAPATGQETIGLGIDAKLDLLTKSTAAHAHVVLLAAQALIKQVYAKLNTAPDANASLAAAGPAPAYLQAQLANYQTALAWLNAMS